ncbi:hypothetical protein NE237_004960 [Protea cynaroides]|uniref:Uncharacterized protein n=1 Tax=Protea cynaroides TaxID=273540 RepID=A0A9Q0KJX4_9MAGN|nr:hypothetical protein NE237_004960 [Protea cynaroides]
MPNNSGLLTHFALDRQLSWVGSMIGLQERIVKEWKKKSAGLLDEMQRPEWYRQSLLEFSNLFQFSTEEKISYKIQGKPQAIQRQDGLHDSRTYGCLYKS